MIKTHVFFDVTDFQVGQDYNHTIGIWDTATGQLLAHTRGGEAKVFDIQWAPNGGGGSFVQVGFQHIKFHVLRGRNVDTEMGIFGDEKDVPFTTMMCVGFVKGTSLCCTCWLVLVVYLPVPTPI